MILARLRENHEGMVWLSSVTTYTCTIILNIQKNSGRDKERRRLRQGGEERMLQRAPSLHFDKHLFFNPYTFSPFFGLINFFLGPSAPRNIRVRATSSTSFLVEWESPATPNGIISSYHIFKGTHKDNLVEHGQVTRITFSKEITGLKKYTTYYVQVRGRTNENGNASEIVQVTTFEGGKSVPSSDRLLWHFLAPFTRTLFHLNTVS